MSPLTQGLNYRSACDYQLILTGAVSSIIQGIKFAVKQSNDLKILPMSSTILSPESCRVISNFSFCRRIVGLYYNFRDRGLQDAEMTTQAEMTFTCHSRSSNVAPIESCYQSLSGLQYRLRANYRHITHRFRDTSVFNAENHILLILILILIVYSEQKSKSKYNITVN